MTGPDGLADRAAIDEHTLRLAEAMIFASAEPVAPRALGRLLPEGSDVAAVIEAVRARHAGRGIELADVAGGVQFRTALDLAPALRKVIEVPRRLSRVAMETLAIVAYHQPVTRPEIEHLRGASLSQQTLDALLEAKLIAPAGRKEAPGRPTLWATTPEFLTAFGLKDLKSLPRREDLFVEPPRPAAARLADPVAANDAVRHPSAAHPMGTQADDPMEGGGEPGGPVPQGSPDADATRDMAGTDTAIAEARGTVPPASASC